MPRPALHPTLTCALLAAVTLTACGPNFVDVQSQDTPEAFEAYIAKSGPTDPYYGQAVARLEELRLQAALKEGTVEAIDAFLAQHPEGKSQKRAEALEEREKALFREAEKTNTPKAWQRYLDEAKKAGKKRKAEARRRLHMAEHLDAVKLGKPRAERVNLAENPEGPLDGWGIYVDVTNTEKVALETLYLTVAFLDEQGQVLDRKEWPAIARALPGNLPVAEEFKQPMRPGETRVWEYTTGDLIDGWTGEVMVAPSHVVLAGEKKPTPEPEEDEK